MVSFSGGLGRRLAFEDWTAKLNTGKHEQLKVRRILERATGTSMTNKKEKSKSEKSRSQMRCSMGDFGDFRC